MEIKVDPQLINKDLLSLEFWHDNYRIGSYVENTVNFLTKRKVHVTVKNDDFNANTIPKDEKEKEFIINIPKPPIIQDTEELNKHIFARSIILRHELAHIVYTFNNDFKLTPEFCNTPEFKFFNILEDARIENLLSKELKGTRGLFRKLAESFIDSVIPEIESNSLNGLFLYFYFKSKDIDFNNVSESYKASYEKYKHVLSDHSLKKCHDAFLELIKDFDKQPASGESPKEEYVETPIEQLAKFSSQRIPLDFNVLFSGNIDGLLPDPIIVNLPQYIQNEVGFSREAVKKYNEIVHKNINVIKNATNFLKLKLFNKNKKIVRTNLDTGFLDQTKLKDLFTNQSEYKIFQNNFNVKKSGDKFFLLIDTSGSMKGDRFNLAVTQAIVFSKVLSDLKIDFSIIFFSSFGGAIPIKRPEKIPSYFNSLDKIESYLTVDGHMVEAKQEFPVLAIMNFTKNKHQIEKVLGTILIKGNLGKLLFSTTPEFQCVSYLGKTYTTNNKKFLCIINDGRFDDFFDLLTNISINPFTINSSAQLENFLNYIKFSNREKNVVEFIDYVFSKRSDIVSDLNTFVKDPLSLHSKILIKNEQFSLTIKKFFSSFALSVEDVEGNEVMASSPSEEIYKKYLNRMRDKNWKIFGIGMKTKEGAGYIGEENFINFDSFKDMTKTFANKISSIF